MEKRILIVDDDPDVAVGLEALLVHSGWEVAVAHSGSEAFRRFSSVSPDVVLLDVMLPDRSGIEILDQIKSYSEETAVIVMSGVGTIDLAVEAMRKGAETFISKPCDFDSLEIVLSQVATAIRTRRELAALKRHIPQQSSFPGVSEAARSVDRLITQIASAPSPVLLEGESGSGKGMAARMIHRRSNRSSDPFVDLNCAGLSRELLESELFGHEKGAFTDASAAKQGLFEIASGGTLFLDEIGELEPSLQARLLKALEEKRFRRVGGVRDVKVDVRLLAATNRVLDEEVSAGRFRKDLYYRLNVIRIRIPPLRERPEDVPLLAHTLLGELANELGVRAAGISDRALDRLRSYSWPGNVRELRNVLERALLVNGGAEVRIEDILLEASGDGERPALTAADVRPLDTVVSEYVRSAIEATGGNVREAARRLKVSPSTVYARLGAKKE